jgi:putative transposase
MRNTFFKLWIHGIFHTTGETPISEALEAMLYYKIEKLLVDHGCEVAAVGGQPDHVHFLFAQNPLISTNEMFHDVKRITTRWYHNHDFHAGFHKFQWSEGYSAYSVSESLLEKTTLFIESQAEIHQKMGFYDEVNKLNALHKVDLRDGGFDF